MNIISKRNIPLGIFRLENILYYGGKAILLIRNPFKALVSWWRHLKYGIQSDTNWNNHLLEKYQNDTGIDPSQGIYLIYFTFNKTNTF